MMKLMTSAAAIALMMSTLTASADVKVPSAENSAAGIPQITVPSAENSGAGIAGLPGSKDGPAVRPGTVGSTAATKQYNLAVAEQDPANIKGLPGSKSGPPAQKVLRGGM